MGEGEPGAVPMPGHILVQRTDAVLKTPWIRGYSATTAFPAKASSQQAPVMGPPSTGRSSDLQAGRESRGFLLTVASRPQGASAFTAACAAMDGVRSCIPLRGSPGFSHLVGPIRNQALKGRADACTMRAGSLLPLPGEMVPGQNQHLSGRSLAQGGAECNPGRGQTGKSPAPFEENDAGRGGIRENYSAVGGAITPW